MTAKKQETPQPTYHRWGDTGASQVNTSGMGGEDTPFVQTATMVGTPFLIHKARHIETKYGPRWMLTIQKYHDLGPDRENRYAITFSEQAPAALQIQTLMDGIELGAYTEDDVFPVLATLVRQGKSYRLEEWDEARGAPALPL